MRQRLMSAASTTEWAAYQLDGNMLIPAAGRRTIRCNETERTQGRSCRGASFHCHHFIHGISSVLQVHPCYADRSGLPGSPQVPPQARHCSTRRRLSLASFSHEV